MTRCSFLCRTALLVITIGLVPCLGGDPNPPPRQHGGGTWASEPPMRHARAAHAVVSSDTAIYALAGTGDKGGAPVLIVERFDGKAWADETTLPGRGLNAPAAVALGGRIYVIGGFATVTNVPTDEVNIYHPATRMWSKATPLPSPRGGHAAVVLDGMIHVIGGGNAQSTLADHSVYDPATMRWSTKAPLPRALGSPAAVAFGGKLYSIGGRSGAKDFGDVYVYDPAADTWSTGPSIVPRATSGAVVYRGAIYLFGGESQARSAVMADVLRLSNGAGKWTPVPSMAAPRSFARAVLFRDAVYVVGGSPAPQRSHSPEGLACVERFGLDRRESGGSNEHRMPREDAAGK